MSDRRDLERVLDGGEVVGAHHDHHRPPIAGDGDPLLGVGDLIDHLGELCLDFSER
jgi:hypothetical protein